MEQDLENSGLEAVAVRVSNAYGPGQVPAPGQGVIAHWLSAALAGGPITVYGDRVSTRDYVFIDDIVEAMARIHASAAAVPAIVNVGSGVPSTLGEVLAAVGAAVGVDRVEVREAPRRGTDTTHNWLDVTRAREALDWSAEVPLVEGVVRAWAWFQAR
jgi:UDP-glucose 4-epimerase